MDKPATVAFAAIKLLLIVVALLVLTLGWCNCAKANDWTLALEIGAEYTRRNERLQGSDPLMYAMLRLEHESGAFVYWRHQSSIFTGWPFNGSRDQMWVDALGVGYRWELARW